MVVYADVLIVLNLIVDYFLLALSAKLLKSNPSVGRLLSGAGVGAISSLYIFLPSCGFIIEIGVRFIICAAMTFGCFGFHSAKRFFRSMAVLFAVTCGYAGGMIALWYLVRPNGMIINNSVVYFNISPLFLIVFSIIGYFISVLLRSLLSKHAALSETCEITVYADGNSTGMTAIVDTGNSIEDVFGTSEIIIADEGAVQSLFGDFRNDESLKCRYRALPCSTVSGEDLLDGYRCDKACISHNGKITELKKPVLAVSKTRMTGDYSAVINPKSLE